MRRVVFENPSAKRILARQGNSKRLFSLENLQSVRIIGRPFATTYLSKIYLGIASFAGVKPFKVVVKEFKKKQRAALEAQSIPPFSSNHAAVIERLNASAASHPKTFYLKGKDGREFIVQEAFINSRTARTQSKTGLRHSVSLRSKLDSSNFLLPRLDLATDYGKGIFKQVAQETAHLAKAGLYYKLAYTKLGDPMIDVFKIVQTAQGPKVLVQDLDTLDIEPDPARAWEYSRTSLQAIVRAYYNIYQEHNAKVILGRVASNNDLE